MLKLRHQVGRALDLVDGANPLTATPDVLPGLSRIAAEVHPARVALGQIVRVHAGSVPYLMLAGNVVAGWQMARALLVAEQALASGEAGDFGADFMRAKITTARFYADHLLTKAPGIRDAIVEGADSVTALAVDAF